MRYFSTQDLLDELRVLCDASSQKVVAERLGFGPAFLCDVLKKRRAITSKLATEMGYIKMPDRYAKKEGS